MKQALSTLTNDDAAEEFVSTSDLTNMRLVRFEVQPNSERVNMRLPSHRWRL